MLQILEHVGETFTAVLFFIERDAEEQEMGMEMSVFQTVI